MRIALVHDYLKEYGGAERVLESLHGIFPDAPIYTAYYDPDSMGPHQERIKKWDIRTSWLQKMPFAKQLISPFRIFAPLVFESFDLSEYDVVISSCSIYFAKAVITKPGSIHISYIHTPPRYLYGYTTSFNYKKHWWTRLGGELINHFLRIFDFETSQRPDILVANSENVAKRISKFYRRDSKVIYPPVDLKEFQPAAGSRQEAAKYFLTLNRLVRGKGTEVVVEACTKLNLSLKVAGGGAELNSLKKIAGNNVEFLGQVKDEERVKLLQNAKALIVASEDEDFGITAVESQAAGTPVIAVKKGGYLETINDGKTGLFFETANVEELSKALQRFGNLKFNATDLRKNAGKFSQENFKKQIIELVEKNSKQF